jgi:MFS family permease
VFGWATGGVIGGIAVVRRAALSRRRGNGSEWVTGASFVSELRPDQARGKGGGPLQSGAGIGSFLASGVWLLIGGLGPSAWRGMYVIGVLQALLVFWIRRGMPESGRWEATSERRRAAQAQRCAARG